MWRGVIGLALCAVLLAGCSAQAGEAAGAQPSPAPSPRVAEAGADLVLSGHAHGGQVRLPGIGGLFAPGQGILPRLTSGVHARGETRLVVSRGLGNSSFPLRVFNPPEIVTVTLRAGAEGEG